MKKKSIGINPGCSEEKMNLQILYPGQIWMLRESYYDEMK